MERVLTWSYGGGVQSVAIAVAVRRGWLPQPAHIIMADTGRELTATWDYLDAYVRPLLAEIGLTVEVAPHSLATVDLYSKQGTLLIPAYHATGKLSTYCSGEWKARVIRRYLRSLGVRSCRTWLGFSTDEVGRIKPAKRGDWQQLWWPLALDLGWNRATCHAMIADAGLPPVPKSACWMCPNRNNAEWRAVRENPQDWAKAIAFDKAIRARDTRGGVFVHHSGVPLDEADIDNDRQPDLWSECGNVCFT